MVQTDILQANNINLVHTNQLIESNQQFIQPNMETTGINGFDSAEQGATLNDIRYLKI